MGSKKFCISLKLQEKFNYTYIPFNPIYNFKDDPGGCQFEFSRPICSRAGSFLQLGTLFL